MGSGLAEYAKEKQGDEKVHVHNKALLMDLLDAKDESKEQ